MLPLLGYVPVPRDMDGADPITSWNLAGSGLCWRSSLTHPGGASPLPAGFVRCHRVLPRPGKHRSGEGVNEMSQVAEETVSNLSIT